MTSPPGGLYGSDIDANMLRAGVAEVFGTFLLAFAGTAVAVSAALSRPIVGPPPDSLPVVLAFGLTLVALVTALGHISGAHVNPAVTLALAVTRNFPWRYDPASLLGALLACGGVGHLRHSGPDDRRARRHHPRPRHQHRPPDRNADHVRADAGHHLGSHRRPRGTGRGGPAIGFALAAAVPIGGPVSGGAVNPARALGPMIVSGTFTAWWAYLVGPILGAVIAAAAYDRFLAHAATPEPAPALGDRRTGDQSTGDQTTGDQTAGDQTSEDAVLWGGSGEVEARPELADLPGDLAGPARA